MQDYFAGTVKAGRDRADIRCVENNRSHHDAHGQLVRLKQVSRIAFYTGIVAAVILTAVLWYLSDDSGTTYMEIIQASILTRQQLAPAMMLSGLFLLAVVALITWLIALYSSFRVAGPLYRFSQNLKTSHEGQPLIGIREDDCLHDVSEQLLDSLRSFEAHNQAIARLAEQAQASLEAGDRDEYSRQVTLLKDSIRQVRIDG